MSDPQSLAELARTSQDCEGWFRQQLKTLVEHKTISPGMPDRSAILAGAEAAQALMREMGAEAELVEAGPGTPSILGRFAHPEPKAKVVIYNHFDVQPATASNWEQDDPFSFEVHEDAKRGFVYRGRGTTDDKGPALCALQAAAAVHKAGLPIDIQILWETEEEIGSPNFGHVLRAKREQLRGDCVVVSDTIWPSAETPAISMGLRGGTQALLRLRTGRKDIHSGIAGGPARNPLNELSALATAIEQAEFWRRGVAPPDAEELAGYARSGFDPEYFKASHDVEKLRTEIPLEMMLGLWARPTFEVHGLVGGYQGVGLKSAIPPEGELKISFRLVPDQDPEKVAEDLKSFVALHNPDVEVQILGRFVPYRGHPTGRVHEAICSAMEAAFGQRPVTVREGGSIGAVPLMQEHLDVPVHFLPLSLPEHGYHAPNECFDWRQAKGGIAAFVHFFGLMARGA